MARSRSDHQLSLPPTELRSSERDAKSFRKTEPVAKQAGTEDVLALASTFFDEAVKAAGLTNQEIAFLCGGISDSLVEKWRRPHERACPSFAQLLMLPPSFHFALHKVMNRRYGFGRRALVELLEATGLVALAVEE